MPPFLHCRWAAGKQDRPELEPVQTQLSAGDAPKHRHRPCAGPARPASYPASAPPSGVQPKERFLMVCTGTSRNLQGRVQGSTRRSLPRLSCTAWPRRSLRGVGAFHRFLALGS